jgi:hypothetical protein
VGGGPLLLPPADAALTQRFRAEHQVIRGDIEQLRIADVGDRTSDETDVADLRGTLYGLYAILRLHTVQEDEAYLSLEDEQAARSGSFT